MHPCNSSILELSSMTDAFYYYRMTISKSMVCMPVHDTWKINKSRKCMNDKIN